MTEEPQPSRTSRTAAVAFGLGICALAAPAVGIGAIQVGLMSPLGGFGLYQLGNLLALLALVVGIAGLILTRGGADPSGRRRAWIGFGCGAALVVALLLVAAPAANLPPINDITTDLTDPPDFEMTAQYPPEFIPIVQASYPDLAPLVVYTPSDQAYARALRAARELGWEVTRESPETGEFEAIAVTPLFRFVDDVVVRVRGRDLNSVIDVRSKSRDGRGDLGANAERIRAFTAVFQDTSPVASQ